MSGDIHIAGSVVTRKQRAPKAYLSGRRCTLDGCTTKLSRYNRHDTCWLHAPVRYPRTRGRVTEGTE